MGFGELLLILVIVVFLFGARKLPALGEGLGKAIRGFRDAAGVTPPASAPRDEAKGDARGEARGDERKELPPGGGAP